MSKYEREFERPHLSESDLFEMRLSGLLDLYLPQADYDHPALRQLYLRDDRSPGDTHGVFAKIQEEREPGKRPSLSIVERQEHDVQAHSRFEYKRGHYVHTNMVVSNGRIMTVGGKQERVEAAGPTAFDVAAEQLRGLVPFRPTIEEQLKYFGKPEPARSRLAAAVARVLKAAR